MKKNLLFSLSAMLLLSACSNDMKDAVDNVPVPQSGLQYMEFTASAGTDTRTELTSDNKVVWQDGDEISIFDGTGNRKFTTKDSGASAIFGGNAASADTYYALYPYQEGATLSGNVIKNVTLPSEQTAKAGSFDAAFNLSVAKASSDLQLAFKNVGSLVKFAVSNNQASKVRKVKLTSYDDTAVLTGTVDITLGSQQAVTSSSGQQPFATLIADNGLETGKYYYFTVLPSELNAGFSLTFFDEQGNTWQKDYTKEANLNRSNILKLAAIEVGAFTNSLLTNANLIAAAEESTGRTFTKNADGSVSLLNDDNYQIAMAVTRLNVRNKGDSSVCEEIGVFSNLEYLDCCSNGITNLDLSNNTALTGLACYNNQLTNLDISKNTALAELHCDVNQLTSLDLTNNTALTTINCSSNQLASLDLTNNTALTFLSCAWNQLTSLDLSKNTALAELHCDANQLTSLDLTNNTALTGLNCGRNQLTSLDLSKNTALTGLACYNNQLTSLDLSNNTALQRLECHYNKLTNLDLSNNTALTQLECYVNQLTSLDLSNNTALTTINCGGNQLTNLDLSKNTSLTYLDCNSNQLTSLDLTNNTALTTCLNCHSNHLKSLDISNHNQLDWGNLYVGFQTDSTTGEDQELTLYVNADQISQGLQDPDGMNKNVNKLLKSDLLLTNANLIAAAEASTGRTFTKNADGSVSLSNDDNYQIVMAVTRIDVSGKEDPTVCEEIGFFNNLEGLNCFANGITSLDLTKNTKLTNLTCSSNQLTSLDLTKNTALTMLNCSWNQVANLDLTKNTKLIRLLCGANQLTSLDLTKNTALTFLDCDNNQLTSLDLTNNTALVHFQCGVNQLTSLDLSNNTELTYMRCEYNHLTSLDISNNNQIDWTNLYVGGQTDSSNNDQTLNLYVNADQYSKSLPDIERNKNVNVLLKE